MQLRNKKTGEIAKLVGYVKTGDDRMFFRFEDDIDTYKKEYNSLAELNEEWEDYENEELPKGYWVIEPYGKVEYFKLDRHWSEDLYHQFKDFGNCFETKEEVEKAVEKLKAWKRLKDKGFRFDGKTLDTAKRFGSIFYWLDENAYSEDYIGDLDLLFGGEDE